MTTIRAHFDGRVFVPESPVDLPVGRQVQVQVPDIPSPGLGDPQPLLPLAELLRGFPDQVAWPVDGAAQHEHYLYGEVKDVENDPLR